VLEMAAQDSAVLSAIPQAATMNLTFRFLN